MYPLRVQPVEAFHQSRRQYAWTVAVVVPSKHFDVDVGLDHSSRSLKPGSQPEQCPFSADLYHSVLPVLSNATVGVPSFGVSIIWELIWSRIATLLSHVHFWSKSVHGSRLISMLTIHIAPLFQPLQDSNIPLNIDFRSKSFDICCIQPYVKSQYRFMLG